MQTQMNKTQFYDSFEQAFKLAQMVLLHIDFLIKVSKIKNQKYEMSEEMYFCIRKTINEIDCVLNKTKGKYFAVLNQVKKVLLLMCRKFELSKLNNKRFMIHVDINKLIQSTLKNIIL